ncbi:Protein of unknown function [Neorhodopirellula lusitana]|uniref:Sulfatase n=1 Tax=Neorhodopirellula lusitana TaxID=445327 RepID=A0ABY1PWG5_9BACT|nr:DUF1501 domain-containing protein [Neorhodopirellula lusitana]SMP50552.1 Protein of unknown function [Neorhodopirellula lusitana]
MNRLSIEQELRRAKLEDDTRRQFLSRCTTGLGSLWMASQAAGRSAHASSAEMPALPHFPAKAKRVIFLHMIGGPSQLELFDYKPMLAKYDGKDAPQEYLDGQRFAFIQGTPQMLGPQFSFKQHGESGAWVSELFPHVASHADKLCFIKTMQTDQFNHGPAQLLVHTGNARIGYPSEGSWVTWGLGTENEDLPGFMVLLSGGVPRNGKALWSSGFLPSVYQGVQCRSQGDPILNISNPKNVTRDIRRQMLDALGDLNRKSHDHFHDPETLTRIAQYEMSFRMQMTVPEVANINDEPQEILDLYGAKKGESSFANNCLLARRFAEAGVRFIQLYDSGWDSHGTEKKTSINEGFADKCRQVDQPISALLTDLQRRGLLEDTLVVWGGEFGRTPMRENRGGNKMALIGRDHAPAAFTLFMAGGGVKPGFTYGETDEFGYRPATDPVHVRDFHATMLHLLGIDSDRMTHYFQGLHQKLTGVKPASVIHEVIG